MAWWVVYGEWCMVHVGGGGAGLLVQGAVRPNSGKLSEGVSGTFGRLALLSTPKGAQGAAKRRSGGGGGYGGDHLRGAVCPGTFSGLPSTHPAPNSFVLFVIQKRINWVALRLAAACRPTIGPSARPVKGQALAIPH